MPPTYAHLPQLTSPTPYLTEAGVETTLIFKDSQTLPSFAAFPLLTTPTGLAALTEAYTSCISIAQAHNTGIVLETPTWRASTPWVTSLGYSASEVSSINTSAVSFLQDLRAQHESPSTPIVISGNLGPLADAYKAASINVSEARAGFEAQIAALVAAGVDMICLATTGSVAEAVAVTELAREADVAVCVSFCVETDGALLGGLGLAEAICEVDKGTDGYVAYFGVNCAHPVHFLGVLRGMDESVRRRIGSLRANASVKSHEELDECEVLDRGDPAALGEYYRELRGVIPGLCVLGGCCGTDEEHIRFIAEKALRIE